MADPFSTAAAVVSFADVTIRACKGIRAMIDTGKDAPNALQRLRQTLQGLQSMSDSLRLYVIEYESSKLYIEQHQPLPQSIEIELRGIESDMSFLQQLLPPTGTHMKRSQKLKWIFDEKKILGLASRLDSRQIAVIASLQTLAQRIGIKIYEDVSTIRNDLQRTDTATASQLEEAKSAIIRTLAEPEYDNLAKIMDRLDHLSTTMTQNEGLLRSNTTLQAASVDAIGRMIRAELQRVIVPSVEEHLNPYKSSDNAQLEGIRSDLDQIISMLGHLSSSSDESTSNKQKDNHVQAADLHESDTWDDNFSPSHNASTGTSKPAQSTHPINNPIKDPIAQGWTKLWHRTWIFHWRIGTLIVRIIAFQYKAPVPERIFQAFRACQSSLTRFTYRVSIEFVPALSLLMSRGIHVECESKQNQRGYYQMCPMLTTFAVIRSDAEAFKCVKRNDIEGLRALFGAGLAAPTDQNEESFSLLHVAAFGGYPEICEYILLEGAHASATSRNGMSSLDVALLRLFKITSRAESKQAAYCSVIRLLIRSRCDIDESFVASSGRYVGPNLAFAKALSEGQGSNLVWSAPPEYLLNATKFLLEQGLNVNPIDIDTRVTLLFYCSVFAEGKEFSVLKPKEFRHLIFLFCLLKADVSVRELSNGYQALHFIFSEPWSAEGALCVIDSAYILIHWGGADVFAVTYEGMSPTLLAFKNGWEVEWITVLERCGMDPYAVLSKELQRVRRSLKLGSGESTTVDTDDLVGNTLRIVTRRNVIIGDRLDD